MPGENPVERATEIPIQMHTEIPFQMPTGFTGQNQPEMQVAPGVVTQEQLANVMGALFGSDGTNEGYNQATDRDEIPQQNFDPPPTPFRSNYEDDLISKFKSVLDERLLENNRRLTNMFMGEFSQSYRCSPKQKTVRTPVTVRTPKEEAHTQSDNAVADSFINYDNAYHVSMSPMVNEDFNEDPEIVKLRRSERLVKPAAAMLSPYVAFKRLKDIKAKRSRNEDRQIDFIKHWYPNCGSQHLSLIVGNSVGPKFWESLLGMDGEGWLSDDHIFGWMIHMYHSRNENDRWSILPPYFQNYFRYTSVDHTCKGYFTGQVDPFPSIHTVDEVYVPLYIEGAHWFLGVFNLLNYTLTIYDSYLNAFEKERTDVVCHINFVFDHWLRIHGYNAHRPLPLTYPFRVIYATDAPQQSGVLGDCGVWVCIFLDRLINKKPLNNDKDTQKTAERMRRQLALLFYDSVLPDTTTDNNLGDDDDDPVLEM
ncbi:putative Ulp1 protease family catalytic domain, papain-like cysteine peptidase superfamily [Helianthus annuus]|uniref:Ulp1 protease family catalytic domain, papain-like cysteine peptidase superfamily n=1 Tax=Helianthus annuus TaxID=4232 RepID=A0A9K3EP39_HELAN|nr:putative Ulp1 protease family catalytic domain, papain-like cysteine peptidase superfamily [Helianthus annuus]